MQTSRACVSSASHFLASQQVDYHQGQQMDWKDLWTQRLRQELLRLIITLTVLLLCTGLMIMAQIQSDRWFDEYNRIRNILALRQHLAEPRGVDIFARDPLHDRGFDLLPDMSELRAWLPDLLLNCLIGLTVVTSIAFPTERRVKWQGIVVLRRFFWCLAILYIFRMCSFMVTTVPSAAKGCMPKYVPVNDREDVQDYLVLMGKMVSGAVTACTDNIYSGHTSLITLLVSTSLLYSGRWYVKLASLLLGAVAVVSIAATRMHYTVDVLIALLVASFVFAIYHFLLVIYINARTMSLDGRLCRTTATTAHEDGELLAEHSLAARMVWRPVGRVLWWMDGLDIRVGPYAPHQLTREREQQKVASAVHSPDNRSNQQGAAGTSSADYGRNVPKSESQSPKSTVPLV